MSSNSSFTVELSVTENGKKSPQYTLDTDLDGEITLEGLISFMRSALISVAHDVLKEEQAKGFDPKPVVAVDGRVNKPVIEVKPFGKIEFTSRQQVGDIITATLQGVFDRSPVDTGLYKSSHRVLLNGKQVASDMESLRAWLSTKPLFKNEDVIRIVNIQPYARRLERLGVTAQRTKTRFRKSRDKRQRSGTNVLAHNGAYFLTSRAMKRIFKRNSSIKFGLIPGYQLGLSATFKQFSKASGSRKSSRSKKSTYLYPTITIRVSEQGTL